MPPSPSHCLQLFIPYGLWLPWVVTHLSAQQWDATPRAKPRVSPEGSPGSPWPVEEHTSLSYKHLGWQRAKCPVKSQFQGYLIPQFLWIQRIGTQNPSSGPVIKDWIVFFLFSVFPSFLFFLPFLPSLPFLPFFLSATPVACENSQGQGPNSSHSSDPSQYNDSSGFLTHCATKELPKDWTSFFFFLIFFIIVDLQCRVNLFCTTKWPSYTYTYTHIYSFSHIILNHSQLKEQENSPSSTINWYRDVCQLSLKTGKNNVCLLLNAQR